MNSFYSNRRFLLALAVSFFLSHPASAFAEQNKTKAFNPDISANFLGLWQRGTAISNDRTAKPHNGFSLQEAEIQFSSDVDTYMKALAILSVTQEAGSSGFSIEPEEVYLETTSLPMVTLRAGKIRLALGKHNQLHSHAYPFIDAPLVHDKLLGDEGLNEIGVSAAVLIPASWYSELIVQAYSPSNENIYKSSSSGDVGGLGRIKNLWDLSDDLTLEFGVSAAWAKNQFHHTNLIHGSDLTFKWRPATGGKYHSLIWSTEYLKAKYVAVTDSSVSPASTTENPGESGIATWVQYQLAERWWVQARYEYMGLSKTHIAPAQNKQSALLGFVPSEFSSIRAQYDHIVTHGKEKADHTIALQYNVSIGAHPAHTY